MFGRKKRKRTKWFSTLLEVEQLIKEGYVIVSTCNSYVWFARELNGVLITVGIKRRFFSDGSGNSLEVIEDYRKHRQRLEHIDESKSDNEAYIVYDNA